MGEIMGEIELLFIRSNLLKVDFFGGKPKQDSLNQHLASITKDYLEKIKDYHFKDQVALSRYLKRAPKKGTIHYRIAPVNLLRYRIFQKLYEGQSIDVEAFIKEFKEKFVAKNIEISDLSSEIQLIYLNHGWGESKDPFKSWADNRKIIYDYIISPNDYREMQSSLDKITTYIKQQLCFPDCQTTTSKTWGEQNNSFKNYCWIAWCPNGSMKKTIHLGVRIYSNRFVTQLYVGDDFFEENSDFGKQELRSGSFDNFDEALKWLKDHRDLCLELNKKRNDVKKELDRIELEKENLIGKIYKPKRAHASDQIFLALTNNVQKDSKLHKVEDCHLYLYKIEGINFMDDNFKGSGVYKIGISKKPKERKVQIIKGFGLASLLTIKEIFIKKNLGKYETKVKEFIDSSDDFYYDGEYFCTALKDNEVKRAIQSELSRLRKIEV